MERSDKELIAHIKDELQEFEAAYDAGAWERFNGELPVRRPIMPWLLRAAAAAAVLFIAIFLFLKQENTAKDRLAYQQQKGAEQSDRADRQPAPVNEDPAERHAQAQQKTVSAVPGKMKDQPATASRAAGADRTATPAVTAYAAASKTGTPADRSASSGQPAAIAVISSSQHNNKKEVQPDQPAAAAAPADHRSSDSFEAMLAADDKHREKPKTSGSAARALQLGMMVSPALGNNQKINMGYGIAVTYALNKKLSVTSGLNYTAMSAFKDIAFEPVTVQDFPATTGFETESAQKSTLESVNASIRGLSVPLELRYHLTEKFYAGAGVSAMAILTQKQQNNYLVPTITPETYHAGGGNVETRNTIVTQKESVDVPGEQMNSAKYLGFYNLSVGFRQKISPKNSIALEPFIRIPMKEFSRENLDLTDAGLRLRFDF
ncbi:hypothetical protein C7T94_16455 [Pedobacter yulinensis]|uniref:Outer membrane protein beta-barrel domain-containing protein n=1 Tax=Pedobacter yulinensis TaxID=2126353 RepID=A0A2T3HIU6_9SPHI|nr:hypothetical protein [Pedobacter yulinensis]PST82368.1 hypothetical protein C7T94_16455 [Pedobacter yulinensis]